MPENPRILVARTDRIGDMVLSLPVFASLRAAYPGARICALARDYTKDLLEGRPDVDAVISFRSATAHIPAKSFFEITRKIRAEKFDAAILLYLNSTVAAAIAAAGVPVRLGPATKAWQVLLTHRVTQRRSLGGRHEADHNLDLLKPLGVAPVRQARIEPAAGAAKRFRKTEGRPLVGAHPGHGGSSRNWPDEFYARLLKKLDEAGCDVALTGAPSERETVERVKKLSGTDAQVYIGSGGLKELASALAELDVYVASSTGPLHVASAAGTPVVGIYSPVSVCLPERWGPIGPEDTALAPDVESCEKCVFEKCPHFDCMESVSVDRVARAVIEKAKAPADVR